MTSRERVLKVIRGEIPDRVPWMENYISNEVTAGVLGRDDFYRINYTQKIERPGMTRISPDLRRVLPLDNLSYDLSPPRFAKTELIGGRENITEGLIKSKEDLKYLDSLPDPDDESLYRPAEEYLNRYKEDAAAVLTLRSGPANTYLSTGIERFCNYLITEPDFVREILWRFSNWTRRVAINAQELPFDLVITPDDIGFGNAPMISPQHFREFCLPVMRNVIEVLKIPVIYHSDGNVMPLMDDLLRLGLSGLANLEPGPMDIKEVKALYGQRLTLMGNIDLHYTLTRGTPEETAKEVEERITALAPGGRYIMASANSLPNYVKPDNVLAMSNALLKFGYYDRPPLVFADAPRSDRRQAPADRLSQPDQFASATQPASVETMEELHQAIIELRQEQIEDMAQRAMQKGFSPEEIINHGLIPAMDRVGQLFSEGLIFVPEMLLAALTMKKALNVLKPFMEGGPQASRGLIMLATVKGDLHDIGKNIVGMMLEGGGFEVLDLGINIDARDIAAQVKEKRPAVLGLSSLLTTTMPEMGVVINTLEDNGLRENVWVIVGGAPVDQKFADQVKADGYAKDAGQAVGLCKRLLGIH